MNLHEYQAKAVLRDYGISTPRGVVVSGADQCAAAAAELGGTAWVAKAQIHAGGRGKAGGVKLVRSVEDLAAAAGALLGSRLTTYQNAPDGQPVGQLLIEETLPIARELYLSITVDRAAERIGFVASAAGGMEIEEVARTSPEKILKEWVNPVTGFMDYQGRNLAFGLGLEGEQIGAFVKMAKTLYKVFPGEGSGLAGDQSPHRHHGWQAAAPGLQDGRGGQRPLPAEGPGGHRRRNPDRSQGGRGPRHEVNYIALNGNIGCMVNGAGLAMATMDLIKLSGGMPANFLDVGGGATAATVAQAFKIILSDPNVKAVLINIFGGIMRCDVIAQGVIDAVKEVGVTIPVVVRLEGTNVDLGRKMLAESGLSILASDDLNAAAKMAVAAVGGN
jgi:succinyl-CoA synthetase beta subunit